MTASGGPRTPNDRALLTVLSAEDGKTAEALEVLVDRALNELVPATPAELGALKLLVGALLDLSEMQAGAEAFLAASSP